MSSECVGLMMQEWAWPQCSLTPRLQRLWQVMLIQRKQFITAVSLFLFKRQQSPEHVNSEPNFWETERKWV